jgi:hypothetical protein
MIDATLARGRTLRKLFAIVAQRCDKSAWKIVAISKEPLELVPLSRDCPEQ